MGRITLEAVTKRFGDVEVIPPLDLTIDNGEFVVFVGPSGCGKSTLLRLIAGLEDVSGGRILIDGQDIAGVTQESLRGAIAMVSQDTSLLHRSIRDNIAYGRPDATEAQIRRATELAEAVAVAAEQLEVTREQLAERESVAQAAE